MRPEEREEGDRVRGVEMRGGGGGGGVGVGGREAYMSGCYGRP